MSSAPPNAVLSTPDEGRPISVHLLKATVVEANSYIVEHRASGHAFLVDPGDPEVGTLLDFIWKKDLAIDFILLTHEHFDHIAGTDRLREELGCKLICSTACAKAVVDPKLNLSRYWTVDDTALTPPEKTFEGLGGILDWQGLEVGFHPTPGHSPGSGCISICDTLFTGDTLLAKDETVTKLPGGNRAKADESLRWLFAAFDGDTQVWPGHGEPFSLSESSFGG